MKLYGDLLGYLTNAYKKRKAKKQEELKKAEETGLSVPEEKEPEETASLPPEDSKNSPGETGDPAAEESGGEKTGGPAAEESGGEKTEDPRLSDPEYQALMNTSLYYLRLKFFTYYTLDKAGFKTIGDVCHPKTEKDVYRLKYLRKKVKKELVEKLKKYDDRLEVGA